MDPNPQQESPSNETPGAVASEEASQTPAQPQESEASNPPKEDRPDVSELFDSDGGDPGDEHVEGSDHPDPVQPSDRPDDFRKAVQEMLWGGPGAGEAARKVLMESGFSKQDADDFVQRAGYNGGEAASQQRQQQSLNDAQVPNQYAEAIQNAEQRAAMAEERSRAVRAKQLEQEMDYQLYRTMSDADVESFVQKLDQLNEGEDDKSRNDRRQVMIQEVRRTALENLGKRTRKANQFDESWIAQEVSRASGMVLGRYKAALGNVDAIGRSSVPVTPEDELRQKKPVQVPAWKPGKQVSDMDVEIRDWTVDVLSRAAMDGGTGESKL